MARRFKSRVTAGRLFKSGVMEQFTPVGAILVGGTRGDGDAGTYHAPDAGEVIKGAQVGTKLGLFTGICDGSGNTFASGIYDGTTRYATTGLTVDMVVVGNSWQDGDGLHAGIAPEESHTANQVLKSAGGNYNDDNLSVGNVRPVAFGLSQVGTLGNLAATDAAYVTLEQSRNADPGEGNVLDGVTYLIRGASYEGSAIAGIPVGDIVGAQWVVVGHNNYVGGSSGTYPTTATSQAAQYAADQLLVAAKTDNIDGGVLILGQEGAGMTPAEVASAMAAAGLTLPGGSYAQTVTVTRSDTAAVIPNAWVSIYSGTTEVDRKQTNGSGVAVPRCNAGTYSIVVACDGYYSSTTTGVSVTAASSRSVTLTAATASASEAGKTTLYGTCYDEDTVAEEGVTVTCKMTDDPNSTGHIYSGKVATATTDANGRFEFTNRVQGATYKITRGEQSKTVLVGTSATQGVGDFIGVDA